MDYELWIMSRRMYVGYVEIMRCHSHCYL